MTNDEIIIFVISFIIFILIISFLAFTFNKKGRYFREGYRDPLYLNRQKFMYDWYPRANGSIYGYPYRYGGSWNLFSGYPYYDKAY